MRAMRTLRAFTLIELLLVMVILAVLASVAVPIYLGYAEESRRKATIAEIHSLKTAIGAFEIENGRLPEGNEGLEALLYCPSDLTASWHGPYFDHMPMDKWGHAYLYENPASQGLSEFNIISAGKDGQFGDDDDLDIYTH